MLNQELIIELQEIMKTDYACELTDQEALEFGELFLASYEALIKLRLENNKSVC